VQASIRNRLITKPFELFFEMQHTALEIGDHRIVGCSKAALLADRGAEILVSCYPGCYPEADLAKNAVFRTAAKPLKTLATPAGFEPATPSLEG
jgi:hypothetical protein